jgi:pimeloyl-ACP methyl ester carboxylesterase
MQPDTASVASSSAAAAAAAAATVAALGASGPSILPAGPAGMSNAIEAALVGGAIRPPSLALFAAEGLRATWEYARMRLMDRSALPRGDDHTVMLFPGLAAGPETTAPLREFCEELGYDACDWGRGRNTGPRGDVTQWLDELAREVRASLQRRGKPTTLIGWSLGGFYAREIAKKSPGLVRQVITLGTPFAGGPEHTNVGWIYRLINGSEPVIEERLAARLRMPMPVPTTSVYSRSDGVVAWESCLDPLSRRQAENIEVESSHCGLCWNPSVLTVIADRLAQPQGRWKPYRPAPGGARLVHCAPPRSRRLAS